MDHRDKKDVDPMGWGWFEADDAGSSTAEKNDSLTRSFARCFSSGDGDAVISHLRETILDRRLGPSASDAELRFLEGQRSVVAHILRIIQRGS